MASRQLAPRTRVRSRGDRRRCRGPHGIGDVAFGAASAGLTPARLRTYPVRKPIAWPLTGMSTRTYEVHQRTGAAENRRLRETRNMAPEASGRKAVSYTHLTLPTNRE